jgi:hypothetical protein
VGCICPGGQVVGGPGGTRLGGAMGSGCSTAVSASVVKSMSGLDFLGLGGRKVVALDAS